MIGNHVKIASHTSFDLTTLISCLWFFQTFPGVTPFDALVYGVAAVSKNLPPGSPATLHCIDLLVQRAYTLKPMSAGVGRQKITGAEEESDGLGDAEKLQLLLLHLIRRVDLQVYPRSESCTVDIADHIVR